MPEPPLSNEQFAQAYVKFRQAITVAENSAVVEHTPLDKIFDLFELWLNDKREQELSVREMTLIVRHEKYHEQHDDEPWKRNRD